MSGKQRRHWVALVKRHPLPVFRFEQFAVYSMKKVKMFS